MTATKNSLRHIFSDPYIQINSILAGVIVAILIYSGIFSPASGYPIHSFYEAATGQAAPSSGLSRAFSEIVRLNFEQAKAYNPYAFRIFAFFALQLLLRLTFSWLSVAKPSKAKQIATSDILISGIAFVYAFYPFLAFLVNGIAEKV